MELYKKYRPKKLLEVLGQDGAVSVLQQFIKRKEIPHALLFTGPSGCGKTTIARILVKEVRCASHDFKEINAADQRGIDDIRDIRNQMQLSPLGGESRVYLIDECFPKNTLIGTPNGPTRLDEVGEGDFVYSLNGIGRVVHVFSNKVDLNRIIKLKMENGQELITTKEHKFLTSQGWMQAQFLEGSSIFSDRRYYMGNHKEVTHASTDLCPFTTSLCLQSGYSLSRKKDSHRSRWEESSLERRYTQGFEEGVHAQEVRVESVEVYKQGSNDGNFVGVVGDRERSQGFVEFMDLQIKGHPSYLPNGFVAHNCHKLTSDAQTALLKMLEDTPSHVYFMLATTDPRKLLKTIHTRCTEIAVKPLDRKEMLNLLRYVRQEEEVEIGEDVYEKVVELAEGSARKALVLLESVLGKDEDEALSILKRGSAETEAIALARALFNFKITWPDMKEILEGLEEHEPENIRWMVLGYAKKILLSGGKLADRAFMVIQVFRDPWYDCKHAGLVASCYEVVVKNR